MLILTRFGQTILASSLHRIWSSERSEFICSKPSVIDTSLNYQSLSYFLSNVSFSVRISNSLQNSTILLRPRIDPTLLIPSSSLSLVLLERERVSWQSRSLELSKKILNRKRSIEVGVLIKTLNASQLIVCRPIKVLM